MPPAGRARLATPASTPRRRRARPNGRGRPRRPRPPGRSGAGRAATWRALNLMASADSAAPAWTRRAWAATGGASRTARTCQRASGCGVTEITGTTGIQAPSGSATASSTRVWVAIITFGRRHRSANTRIRPSTASRRRSARWVQEPGPAQAGGAVAPPAPGRVDQAAGQQGRPVPRHRTRILVVDGDGGQAVELVAEPRRRRGHIAEDAAPAQVDRRRVGRGGGEERTTRPASTGSSGRGRRARRQRFEDGQPHADPGVEGGRRRGRELVQAGAGPDLAPDASPVAGGDDRLGQEDPTRAPRAHELHAQQQEQRGGVGIARGAVAEPLDERRRDLAAAGRVLLELSQKGRVGHHGVVAAGFQPAIAEGVTDPEGRLAAQGSQRRAGQARGGGVDVDPGHVPHDPRWLPAVGHEEAGGGQQQGSPAHGRIAHPQGVGVDIRPRAADRA